MKLSPAEASLQSELELHPRHGPSSSELASVAKLHPHIGDDNLPLLNNRGSSLHHDHTRQAQGAGLGSAVFNLTTTIVGAGIMALPATMKVLGIPLGLIAILTMGLVSDASIEMLILFSTFSKVWSYGETVQGACGSVGRKLAELCIIINNAGILVVYLIIIGEVLSGSQTGDHQGLFDQWAGGIHGWWSNRILVVFITVVAVLAPLCFLKRIDSLRFTSAVSVLLAVVFVILSTGIATAKFVMGDLARPRIGPDLSSVLDLLVVIPIMTNAYICHFNVHPIYCELQQRTPATMNKVGRFSTLLCVIVYAMTAISGYLLFGDSTASDVLTNFDKDLGIRYSTLLNNVIRIGYVVHLMLVFPVIHFSLRQTVELFFFPRAPESHSRFVCLTVILLTLVYLGSTLIPNIWIAFEFTGATTGLSLGFIFPALVGLRWWKTVSIGPRRRILIYVGSWAMLMMAVTVSLIGVTGNILSLTRGIQSKG